MTFTLTRARIVFFAIAALWVTSLAGAKTERPNFVFILIDDMGYSDVAAYGSDYYETPHIDQLAAEGVRFTQAYAASTVCSPTRVSLMTGKYPGRLHITHAIPIEGHLRRPETAFRDADYVKNLPLEEVTIAEALKGNDYTTGYVGKWHTCWDEEYYPEHQGFDFNFGGNNMGSPGSYFFPFYSKWRMTPDHPWVERNVSTDGEPGEFLTDRLTQEAVDFIEANADDPFFLYLAHYSVHTPIQAEPHLIKKYEAKPKDEARGHTHATYAAMIESVDDSVGQIVETLAELDLTENTIIIFTSDNGGAHMVTSNHPWRGDKGNFYEGGIRVPAIVKWPGIASPGTVSDAITISPDFYPTILEMAGLPLMPEQHQDGISLAAHLRTGDPLERDTLFWDFPHYISKGANFEMSYPTSTVRSGDWKLIQSLEDSSVELFNLAEDPQETTDLSIDRHDKVTELRGLLTAHRIAIDAQNLRPR